MNGLRGILLYALPVVIAIATLEGLIRAFLLKQDYNWRSSFASFCDAVLRTYLIEKYLVLSVAAPVLYFAYRHRIGSAPVGPLAGFAAVFLGQEFCYYWFHRAAHRVRWFWATHAVHHSPNELNFSAAYRLGLTGKLSGSALFFAPLLWLGLPPAAVFGTLSLNLLYQFWLHTDWCPKLGPLEYVLNTPSHHRVHHASNLDYLDANYGGILIVFDRLFGTLTVERPDLPCRFGLVKPLATHNPLLIAIHEWRAMLGDIRAARSWHDRLRHLFGPPGWQPDGKGATTDDLRRAAREPALIPVAAE